MFPQPFKQAQNEQLKGEFSQSNSAVIAALKSYQSWLRKDVLPRSHGDFRFGAETYSKLLLYDEMVDTPLPRLLQIGYADLHQNQAEFNRIAGEVDPQPDNRARCWRNWAATILRPTICCRVFATRFRV